MSKEQKSKPKNKADSFQLGVIYPNSAGIDVGSMNMLVSYQGRDGISIVKEYGSYTEDLHAMAEALKSAEITHVAMEATGSYWMSLFEVLEEHDIHITVVNPSHYKNVAGQKTDVSDSQWIHTLHAHGLFRASHIADESYRELRTYIHERGIFQKQKSDTLNRIQKTLTQMNIKYQHLISDIEGVTGMQILQRIATGGTDAETILSGLNLKKLKASKEELVKSLTGVYKPHFITVLNHHLKAYDFYKAQMLAYETEIEGLLKKLVPKPVEVSTKTQKSRKNQYHFNLKEYLHALVGVDLTEIAGLEENTVLTILSVTGLNMGKWPTADHFTSWLNLAARPKKTGGKVFGHQKRFTNNPATQALRMAAQTMWQNKGVLGQLYRRLSASKGSKKAIKAVARRLAVIFYNMVSKKTSYDPKLVALDQEQVKARKIARLKKEAEKLGCTINVAAA
ncbi:MAG: IS110 family transposase [Sphingobacteriaceae bacterium]|nr:IS110 family transposase [Sphingobacteriaceae bacterium]